MDKIDRDLLWGRWVLSHEESEGDHLVFRTADYPFPPARGRRGFAIIEDGAATSGGPGPDDRPVEESGVWELDGRHLSVRTPVWDFDLEIERLDRGQLIAREYSKEETNDD